MLWFGHKVLWEMYEKLTDTDRLCHTSRTKRLAKPTASAGYTGKGTTHTWTCSASAGEGKQPIIQDWQCVAMNLGLHWPKAPLYHLSLYHFFWAAIHTIFHQLTIAFTLSLLHLYFSVLSINLLSLLTPSWTLPYSGRGASKDFYNHMIVQSSTLRCNLLNHTSEVGLIA